jgi:7-cyano-7-deazaguanine reductase
MPTKKTSKKNPAQQPSRRVAAKRSAPSRELQIFDNPAAGRDFLIHIEIPEFTCLCPLTGQPDFATMVLDYIPANTCVELKSLKLYMWSFRDRGAFHEAVTNQILDDMVAAIKPRFLRVTAKWYVRGGIFTNVIVEHRAAGFKPQPAVDLSVYGAVASSRSTA